MALIQIWLGSQIYPIPLTNFYVLFFVDMYLRWKNSGTKIKLMEKQYIILKEKQ